DGFSIKWPNDIYWNDKKIGGILIENSLQSGKIKWTVIGVGLNINQKTFISDAPNPVSLCQITGKRIALKPILNDICNNIGNLYILMDYAEIRKGYAESLYRKEGFHLFRAEGETFEAKIDKIYPDGKLELETKAGEKRGFYFKEVEYVIS
ncbi:MAG: biotin--[acetyl-CoA-carboxylase] ligase, partial [Bacteroidales bacterium]|nr:biotin--[acetyl-CoA-carboxylase] ligase [Bacteroidales bacterium]